MAITQDAGSLEKGTIVSTVSSVKSDLRQLQEELDKFLRVSVKEDINKPAPLADPIAETIADLQDCRKLIVDIRHLAIDNIVKRIAN